MSSTTPQSLAEQGKKRFQSGDYMAAAACFAQAEQGYQASGAGLQAAEMANNRSVALLKAGDASGALATALGTELIFEQAGDMRSMAMALGNQAAAYEDLQDYQQAMSLYQRSSDLLKECGDNDLRSYVLQKISQLQLRKGEHFEAVATLNTALDNRKKLGLRERTLKGLLKNLFNRMGDQ